MRHHVRSLRGLSPLAALALACALGPPAHATGEDVGVLAAVNREVTGARPTEPPRQLLLNERLITDERVTTSTTGGGQVLFLDQTSLTLSPGSDIVLDRYLYDPETEAGEVTVSILKGAMRLVGGRITKTGVATIRTPSATIGIRGGIGVVEIGEDGGTTYVHIAGASSTITNGEGTVTITRQGGAASAPGGGGGLGGGFGGLAADFGVGGGLAGAPAAGGPPVYQGVATPEMLAATLGVGVGRGDGGARIPVTPAIVEPRIEPIELRISRAPGATSEPPISTTGERESDEFEAPPPDLGELPEAEIADANIARTVADEVTQLLDGLTFDGTWTAFAALNNGDFVLPQDGLTFQMRYSLTGGAGVVAVELPATGDAFAEIPGLNGGVILGDSFIVIGDEDLNLVGDPNVATLLGGDAEDTSLRISASDVVSGEIFIDYAETGLTNTAFVDGVVAPTTGERGPGAPILREVNARRD